MGSGSLEPACASGLPSITSKKAIKANDTATFVCLSMTHLLWESTTLITALRFTLRKM
jgi:hypothetical protein